MVMGQNPRALMNINIAGKFYVLPKHCIVSLGLIPI